MELILPAFIAGLLTILAPCVLPLLPVIVGGSAVGKPHRLTPVVITASLAVSVVIFTLLVRASTVLLDIPTQTWAYVSGGLIAVLGVILLFPQLWERVSLRFNIASNKALGKSSQQSGWTGSILTGAALGPVFTSCSPTYAFILFSILPRSYSEGFMLLVVYVIGLSIMLLAIAYLGTKATKRLSRISDPNGWFKRGMGVVFIGIGIAVATGFDKDIETWILDQGLYAPIETIERNLLN